jgi:hypothetical protein
VGAAGGAVRVGATAGGTPTAVRVGPRSPTSGVGVVHGTGVSVDCALGVLAASKAIGAALGPQADAITVQSTTSFATDLEYGGPKVSPAASMRRGAGRLGSSPFTDREIDGRS